MSHVKKGMGNSQAVFFCEMCNDILYPQLEIATKEMIHFCRRCQEPYEKPFYLIFNHQISHEATEEKVNIPDIGTDPSLPRDPSQRCIFCSQPNPVYYQSSSKHPDTKLTLYYVCSEGCGEKWTSTSTDRDMELRQQVRNNASL